MDRRGFLGLIAAFGGFAGAGRATAEATAETPAEGPAVTLGSPEPFSHETLVARARAMAAQEYAPRAEVPKAWRDLTYDQYRLYWFNSQKALWRDTPRPVRVDFFHPGLYFPRPVGINVVEDGMSRPVAFDLSLFDHTDNAPALPVDGTLGYSGLRLRGEIEEPGIYQEYAVFQGASYFRALARGQVYGLSARGLAINTGEAAGEEFPDFTDFWIEAPAPGSRDVTIHALMDSPSVAAAYRFVIRPGVETVMAVTTDLFARREMSHVGIAPLTSMFLFDETNRNRFDDFRPQVHDSDGLMIRNGAGETLWRTLANPLTLQVSSFVDDSPRGFGLMQRSRRFSDFADLEAEYHRRPSLWIEPGEGWGRGAVALVEIPADKEIYDNIVAYWRPRDPVPAGGAVALHYTLRWGQDPAGDYAVAPVINSRMGARAAGGRIATVDFAPHPALPEDLELLSVHVSSNAATITGTLLQRNPETGGARLAFDFAPSGNAAELRAQLMLDGRSVTEVWLYRWTA